MMLVLEHKQMQLLLNVGGPDRVSRVQMAEAVADIRGHNAALIKPVSSSSVSRLLAISEMPMYNHHHVLVLRVMLISYCIPFFLFLFVNLDE